MIVPERSAVDLLILGAGWTSTFLIPLLESEGVSYGATTTTGRDGTIPFRYDPESDDTTQFLRLPTASTVLITFPLKGKGPSKHLTELYRRTHISSGNNNTSSSSSSPSSSSSKAPPKVNFVQLGATSIWTAPTWQDDRSPYDEKNARAQAEDELLAVADGAVLNLAGLYGGARQPRNWVDRVVKTKADLAGKGALHLIHGADVARAIVALHRNFTPAARWLLCDMHVYDWWDLVEDWAVQTVKAAATAEDEKKKGISSTSTAVVVDRDVLTRQIQLLDWVGELMVEKDVKALPRDSHLLGRRLDGRAFWKKMGIWPTQGRVR